MKFAAPVTLLALVIGALALLRPHHSEPLGQTPGLSPAHTDDRRMTARIDPSDLSKTLAMYEEITGRTLYPSRESLIQRLDRLTRFQLSRRGLVAPAARIDTGLSFHGDGFWRASEVKEQVEEALLRAGLVPIARGRKEFILRRRTADTALEKVLPRPIGWGEGRGEGERGRAGFLWLARNRFAGIFIAT